MKPAKLAKYSPEAALTVLELAFYQNGGLDSKKELDAGNAAVKASVEFLIKNKRVPKGFFVSLQAIAMAPSPIVIITETWAEFQLARIQEQAAELRAARIAAGLPAEEPVSNRRKPKKKKKKAAPTPQLIDPNKPLTHGAVKWMKDALQNKQELLERRRKERMAQNGKLDHVAAEPIVIDESITSVRITSHPSVARSATETLQARA